MKYFKYTDYDKASPEEVKEYNRLALEAMMNGKTGHKRFLEEHNFDIRSVILASKYSSIAEEEVRNYLNSKSNTNWQFVDELHDCFRVADLKDYEDKPDLISESGLTADVKRTDRLEYVSQEKCKITFTKGLKTPEAFWKKLTHDADILLVYDSFTKMLGAISKAAFFYDYKNGNIKVLPQGNKYSWTITLRRV